MIATLSLSLPTTWQNFARRQPREELARQYVVVAQLQRDRRALSIVAYMTAAVFLPIWLCVLLFLIDTVAELAGVVLLRDLDPAAQPLRYYAMLASYMVARWSIVWCRHYAGRMMTRWPRRLAWACRWSH